MLLERETELQTVLDQAISSHDNNLLTMTCFVQIGYFPTCTPFIVGSVSDYS